MMTGTVRINVFQGTDNGTVVYASMDVHRPLQGPVVPHLEGAGFVDIEPTREGLENCQMLADGIEVSFGMGPIFPIATLKKEGHTTLRIVCPWNNSVPFSLLTKLEAEEQSFQMACRSERDGEFARYNAFEQN